MTATITRKFPIRLRHDFGLAAYKLDITIVEDRVKAAAALREAREFLRSRRESGVQSRKQVVGLAASFALQELENDHSHHDLMGWRHVGLVMCLATDNIEDFYTMTGEEA